MQRFLFGALLCLAVAYFGRVAPVEADQTQAQAAASGLLGVATASAEAPIPLPPAPQPEPDPDPDGDEEDAPRPARPKVVKVARPRVECDGDSCRIVDDCDSCRDSCRCSSGECGDGGCHSAGPHGHAHHSHGGPVRRMAHAWRHRRFRPLQRLLRGFCRGCRGCG